MQECALRGGHQTLRSSPVDQFCQRQGLPSLPGRLSFRPHADKHLCVTELDLLLSPQSHQLSLPTQNQGFLGLSGFVIVVVVVYSHTPLSM